MNTLFIFALIGTAMAAPKTLSKDSPVFGKTGRYQPHCAGSIIINPKLTTQQENQILADATRLSNGEANCVLIKAKWAECENKCEPLIVNGRVPN